MPDIVISSRSALDAIAVPGSIAADQPGRRINPAPRHRQGAYDNAFEPDNVYGHAVELLSRHPVKPGALHIDIGCGFGRIAEPLVGALGIDYLGCDLDQNALRSLAQRGFETHSLVLDSEPRIYQRLEEIIAGRPLASISIIDTLEHLDDPAAAMRALSRIAAQYQAFVLISVPNTAHRDLGLRLLFGLWDYTETGILDHTHRTLFSDAVLRRMLAGNGLHAIDAHDVTMAASDQAFPADHPAFQAGTLLHRLLADLRDLGDRFGDTNQLVRLCTAGPASASPVFVERETVPRPCLSVVIRSEGRQPDLLIELMTCLGGQTVADFEILIIGHALDRPRQVSIEQVIVELPEWLRLKIRFVRIEQGSKADILNAGFATAAGRYIAVLDEGDAVLAHWAETLVRASQVAPGQILRGVAVTQTIRRVEYNYATGLRAETGLQRYPSEFDLVDHLRADCSPMAGIAFPRGLYHHLHLTFDPALEILSGWDYLTRGAALTGVTSVSAVIAVHRPCNGGEKKRVEFERMKLTENFGKVAAFLWPASSAEKLVNRLDEVIAMHGRSTDAAQAAASQAITLANEAKQEIDDLRAQIAVMVQDIARLSEELSAKTHEIAAKSAENAAISAGYEHKLQSLQAVLTLYGSARFQLLAPLRFLGRLVRGRPSNQRSANAPSASELFMAAQGLNQPRLSGPAARDTVQNLLPVSPDPG